jgi:hypothetical protein
LALAGGDFFFVSQLQRFRWTGFNTSRFLTDFGSLYAKVTFDHRFAIARDVDYSKWTNHQTKLTANAQILVNQHWAFSLLAVNGSGGTN